MIPTIKAVFASVQSAVTSGPVAKTGLTAAVGIGGAQVASTISAWLQMAILAVTLLTALIRVGWEFRKFQQNRKNKSPK